MNRCLFEEQTMQGNVKRTLMKRKADMRQVIELQLRHSVWKFCRKCPKRNIGALFFTMARSLSPQRRSSLEIQVSFLIPESKAASSLRVSEIRTNAQMFYVPFARSFK
ncbi:hypothetical protein FGO68_gene7426 [Halteria grandinella]|uniref:Uncharacterized protein n=1 Tax=Halteria grandinella TaxID=5974 RepID=A0A8J8NQJ8_HALGN|nr:hypothetical protein FGO68_gene7426 [Halteria grandinella]